MKIALRLAAAAALSCAAAAQAQSYVTSFEAPQFVPGDVLGQNGWGHISNSPTRGAIEPLPAGAPAGLGAQALALRTRNVDFFGVANHLFSPTIDPPAGETGATVEGVVAPAPNDYFLATFWYRMPSAALVSTRADGRFAELNPSSKGAGADVPANRYAQVRLFNNTNTAAGLVRVETGWYTPGFVVATVADGLAWGEWYRFEYALRAVDGVGAGGVPNDLFTLRIFDRDGALISSSAASTCGATWELPWRSGSFGGSAAPRGVNGFDFWAVTGPNDTLVGHVDGLSFQSLPMPDAALATVSGDGQEGFTGATLPAPLAVTVTNTAGDHARCHPVTFAVQSTPAGAVGAAVGTPIATPDADSGDAASSATLGNLPGTYVYSATSPALVDSPVSFEAQAVAMQPALALQKALTSAPAFLVPGSVLGYTVTATNTGNVPLTAVTVSDPLLDTPNAACADLAVGASCVLAGNYTIVAGDVQAGSVDNTASADSAQTAPVQASLSTPIPRADLALTKSDGGADFLPGGPIDYTLAVSNAGPDAAQQLQVTDTLPAGVQFFSAAGAGWDCGFAAGTVTCTRATLAAGASAPIALSVDVDPGFSGASILNQASVSNAVADPQAANDTGSVVSNAIQGGGPADLRLSKIADAAQVARGATIVYTLTVSNVGVATALDTVLTDATPPGLEFLDATAPCSGGFPCALGPLPNAASVTVTARYRVPPGYLATHVENTATVAASTPDPTPADNGMTASVAILAALPVPAPIPVPAAERGALLLLALAALALGAFHGRGTRG